MTYGIRACGSDVSPEFLRTTRSFTTHVAPTLGVAP